MSDDSNESIMYEGSTNSSDLVSWYSSDYEQQEHDLEVLDKLREDTQQLIEQQKKNSTLIKRDNQKYSQNLITSIKNNRYLVYIYIYIY